MELTPHTCQARAYVLGPAVLQSAPSAWKTRSNFSIPARLASLLFFKHASHILTFEPLHWLFSLLECSSRTSPRGLPLHSSPTSWSSLSMPSTRRPPGTHLQRSRLGLLPVAVKENTHHGALGASQSAGVRKDLQGLGLFLSRSITVIEWPCLGLMFCEIVYIPQENATAWLWVPGLASSLSSSP